MTGFPIDHDPLGSPLNGLFLSGASSAVIDRPNLAGRYRIRTALCIYTIIGTRKSVAFRRSNSASIASTVPPGRDSSSASTSFVAWSA